DSTSSHLQISDGVRIQQRQLLGEALATTPFRRQERDFFPQRLRSEIGRVPFRRTRDSKNALEKPAVSGHFRRVSTAQSEFFPSKRAERGLKLPASHAVRSNESAARPSTGFRKARPRVPPISRNSVLGT